MERLGESSEFGGAIASLLVLSGWTVHESRPAIGGGNLWIASRIYEGKEYRVQRIGEKFADVAADLLKEALELLRPVRHQDLRLRFPPAA